MVAVGGQGGIYIVHGKYSCFSRANSVTIYLKGVTSDLLSRLCSLEERRESDSEG